MFCLRIARCCRGGLSILRFVPMRHALLVALVAVAGAAEGAGTEIGDFLASSGDGRARSEAASAIVWETLRKRVELAEDRASTEFIFPFRVGPGVDRVQITEVATGCGCATPVFDQSPLARGAASEVRVTYSVGSAFGEQRKTVRVAALIDGKPRQYHLEMRVDVPRIFHPFEDTVGYSVADVLEARRTGAKRSVSMRFATTGQKVVELANEEELKLFSADLAVSDTGVVVLIAPRDVPFPEVTETRAEKVDVRLTYPNGQSRIQRVWILLYK